MSILALGGAVAGAAFGCGVMPTNPTGVGGTGGRPDGGAVVDGGACSRVSDALRLRVTRPDGTKADCAAAHDAGTSQYPPRPGRFTFDVSGIVEQVAHDSFTVDSCAPETGCSPTLTTFTVEARDVVVRLRAGAAVRVQAEIAALFGCNQNLEVEALPSFGTTASPVEVRAGLLLAAYEGGAPGNYNGMPTQPGVPVPPSERPHFFVTTVGLGCSASPGCNVVPADDYAFVFSPKSAPEQQVRVAMGETKPIDLLEPSGPGHWHIRNLKSYQTAFCDDYWNFGYYVSAASE